MATTPTTRLLTACPLSLPGWFAKSVFPYRKAKGNNIANEYRQNIPIKYKKGSHPNFTLGSFIFTFT